MTRSHVSPDISIIVPVHNTEKYLQKCLNSLINQSFENIEIMCINDGSTDGSLEILKENANKDFRIKVFSQENAGPGKARKIGLKNARGKYVMFCDSDDWYEHDMCKIMFETIEKEKVDLVACNSNFISNNCEYGKNICNPLISLGRKKIIEENTSNASVFLTNKIYKKEIIDKYNITFPQTKRGEDDVFNFQYGVVADEIYSVPNKLYNYVLRENSTMYNTLVKRKKCALEVFKIFEFCWDFLCKNNLQEKYFIYFSSFFKTLFCFLWMSVCENQQEEVFKIVYELASKIDDKFLSEETLFLGLIKKRKFKKLKNILDRKEEVSLLQKIFSIKNFENHKKIRILGLKISLKRKIKNPVTV